MNSSGKSFVVKKCFIYQQKASLINARTKVIIVITFQNSSLSKNESLKKSKKGIPRLVNQSRGMMKGSNATWRV